MKNRDLIRDSMMFAVKDITGRVLREATVQSMIDDFEKQLNIPVVVGQSEQLKAVEKLKDFAYEVCPLHREDDLEEIVGSL